MRTGSWVLALFAAGCAGAGLLVSGHPLPWLLIPLLVSGALAVWASMDPATAQARGPHVRKLVARWSIVEGVAIFMAIRVLQHIGRADAVFPVVAIIVGLHFVPLARGIPVRTYYLPAVGLPLVGLAALLVPEVNQPLAVGLCAAAILWTAAAVQIMLVHGARRRISSHGDA